MVTVLDALTRSDVESANVLARLQENFQAQAEQRARVIGNEFQSRTNSVELRAAPWRDVKDATDEATSKLSETLGRVRRMKENLDGLVKQVVEAGRLAEAGETQFDVRAALFNSLVRGLVNIAEDGGSRPNLLGPAEPTYRYQIDANGAEASVRGAHLGSDYRVVDTNGDWWVPDRDARHLKKYDSFPDTPTNEVGAFEDGLRLDSLVDTTITFTVGPNTGSPQSVTGELVRDDLGLIDAWYYDSLETADGRARALEDLDDVRTALNLEIGRYETAISVAQFYNQRAIATLDGYSSETNELLLQQAAEVQKAQDELTRQFQATTSTVGQGLALRTDYANLFAPFIGNKFASSLIDLLV